MKQIIEDRIVKTKNIIKQVWFLESDEEIKDFFNTEPEEAITSYYKEKFILTQGIYLAAVESLKFLWHNLNDLVYTDTTMLKAIQSCEVTLYLLPGEDEYKRLEFTPEIIFLAAVHANNKNIIPLEDCSMINDAVLESLRRDYPENCGSRLVDFSEIKSIDELLNWMREIYSPLTCAAEIFQP